MRIAKNIIILIIIYTVIPQVATAISIMGGIGAVTTGSGTAEGNSYVIKNEASEGIPTLEAGVWAQAGVPAGLTGSAYCHLASNNVALPTESQPRDTAGKKLGIFKIMYDGDVNVGVNVKSAKWTQNGLYATAFIGSRLTKSVTGGLNDNGPISGWAFIASTLGGTPLKPPISDITSGFYGTEAAGYGISAEAYSIVSGKASYEGQGFDTNENGKAQIYGSVNGKTSIMANLNSVDLVPPNYAEIYAYSYARPQQDAMGKENSYAGTYSKVDLKAEQYDDGGSSLAGYINQRGTGDSIAKAGAWDWENNRKKEPGINENVYAVQSIPGNMTVNLKIGDKNADGAFAYSKLEVNSYHYPSGNQLQTYSMPETYAGAWKMTPGSMQVVSNARLEGATYSATARDSSGLATQSSNIGAFTQDNKNGMSSNACLVNTANVGPIAINIVNVESRAYIRSYANAKASTGKDNVKINSAIYTDGPGLTGTSLDNAGSNYGLNSISLKAQSSGPLVSATIGKLSDLNWIKGNSLDVAMHSDIHTPITFQPSSMYATNYWWYGSYPGKPYNAYFVMQNTLK